MSAENAFWIASAVTQSSAAVMGLVIATYVFLWRLFDPEEAGDAIDAAERAELYRAIRANLHTWISLILLLLMGGAVVGVLGMVLFPGPGETLTTQQMGIVYIGVSLFGLAIALAVYFILFHLSPDFKEQVARRRADSIQRPAPGEEAGRLGEFMSAFIRIEKRLRDRAEKMELLPDRPVAAGFLIDVLREQGALPEDLVGEIKELSRYRNLVVHGQLEEVPERAVEWARSILERLVEEEPGGEARI